MSTEKPTQTQAEIMAMLLDAMKLSDTIKVDELSGMSEMSGMSGQNKTDAMHTVEQEVVNILWPECLRQNKIIQNKLGFDKSGSENISTHDEFERLFDKVLNCFRVDNLSRVTGILCMSKCIDFALTCRDNELKRHDA